jgi:hypothetical protein
MTDDKPLEDEEARRKRQEEAIREADEAAKRFQERLDKMNRETDDLRGKIDEL